MSILVVFLSYSWGALRELVTQADLYSFLYSRTVFWSPTSYASQAHH